VNSTVDRTVSRSGVAGSIPTNSRMASSTAGFPGPSANPPRGRAGSRVGEGAKRDSSGKLGRPRGRGAAPGW
jgi:hypothetical protein